MVDADMVAEVKGLLKEGYSLEKVRANLIKIGYNTVEVEEIISEAAGVPAAPVQPKPAAPAPEPAAPAPAEELSLEGLQAPPTEAASDEDILLAAAAEEPAEVPKPAKLPEVGKPPEAKPEHPRHHRPKPAEPPAEVPEKMGEETKPKSGFGKAFIILIFALIIILVLAYFLLFPKLGIDPMTYVNSLL